MVASGASSNSADADVTGAEAQRGPPRERAVCYRVPQRASCSDPSLSRMLGVSGSRIFSRCRPLMMCSVFLYLGEL